MTSKITLDKSYYAGSLPFTMTNDYLFKALLQSNITVLKSLICSFLPLSPDLIKSVTIMNPIHLGHTITAKEMILDIKASLNNNHIINLEMQVINHKNYEERSLSYLSRCFDNLEQSDDYNTVKPAIHIGFLDYTLKPENTKFFSTYRLLDIQNHYPFTGKFEINVVDLTRRDLATEDDIQSHRLLWADFFKAATWEELEMLAQKDSNIAEAVYTIKQLTDEEYFRLCCEAQEDRIRNQKSLLRIHQQELEERNRKIVKMNNELMERSRKLEQTNQELEHKSQELEHTSQELEHTRQTLDNVISDNKSKEEEILHLKQQLAYLSSLKN